MLSRACATLVGAMKPAFFDSAADFRAWLEQRHATAPERFGGMDGARKRLDANAYTIRFSPRQPRSLSSATSTRRIGIPV